MQLFENNGVDNAVVLRYNVFRIKLVEKLLRYAAKKLRFAAKKCAFRAFFGGIISFLERKQYGLAKTLGGHRYVF